MALTPDQARARLTEARRKMKLATTLHSGRGRVGFDAEAGLTEALEEVITFLEDALA